MSESVKQRIAAKLDQGLALEYVQVDNESYQHNVPANSETHFKLVLVSKNFVGKRLVARHQQIYQLLQEELAGPVHSLALHCFTPEEWQQRQQVAQASPACLGGSKQD